jgi:hypothetical protein
LVCKICFTVDAQPEQTGKTDMKNAYFVVDDVIEDGSRTGFARDGLAREGFEVLLGDPDTAIGLCQGAFDTLKLAEDFIKREGSETYYRVFLARRHGKHSVKFVRIGGMLVFENGMDIRSRTAPVPEVAKFHMGNGVYEFVVIGTQYGHIHTTGGDVRTWKTKSGARHAIKRYTPL